MLVVALACELDSPYLDPDGPRYAGDYSQPDAMLASPLRVVSYNLEFGREVDTAIAALQTSELGNADIVLMQEMDADATERIAEALSLAYVYYPASVKNGSDFGNAVLARVPITSDAKLLLPHADPYTASRRIATSATVESPEGTIRIYSTHTATVS
ncbi:MAG: endonuclease/exonuclease/phosphatase family protein, partial [Deltaproteobacteria bacterium]|nr:endonuclease/exonuclease/phosphatase family protein [Deltaproteobacteria bacterium]